VDLVRVQAAGMLQGSASPHAGNGLTLLGNARGELEQGIALVQTAAARCRQYVAAVDPDGAGGSVAGLPQPQPFGEARGGYTDGHGAAPLGRRALADVSRRRTHVYTEFGPEGFQDLLERGEGIVGWRSRWLDAAGHARLRHGGTVSDELLKQRALRGSGAPTDWEHGGNHPPTRHATAFTSDAAAVYVEMAVWDTPAGTRPAPTLMPVAG
jgi:hypothetical protein